MRPSAILLVIGVRTNRHIYNFSCHFSLPCPWLTADSDASLPMSASGDFGPAPPGVNLSENQNGSMLGAVITLIILGTLSVVLRIYARTEFKKFRFSIDDYLSFAALLILPTIYLVIFLLARYLFIIVTINVACDPIPYFWEQYTDPNTAVGSCIDIPKFFFGNGIAAVLIDIMILIIPIPITWKLQMPKTQRLAVIGILLLGSL
ncbi:hypothetical protein AO1008_08619 [Aspergillus oryzae 100-8]|uniref:Rhodopsin domain-containing protein n=1 Tax=Aspergillus oryzae (strain 3.042) TaxID=1160506 RepID=I8TGA1_ASPO3|nr:hypothetical protein Ao3042_10971 [Aspergillus oryzae 3.042]KDE82115.1 hypothetical protein AO1008_08619 [Aspergillus oryzae 100-8]|eukprot:EIT73050.1 hypothetical protein Ao3042_10971 [Aspergillus oryzae 3.042]